MNNVLTCQTYDKTGLAGLLDTVLHLVVGYLVGHGSHVTDIAKQSRSDTESFMSTYG
jgi:hypothetical protein